MDLLPGGSVIDNAEPGSVTEPGFGAANPTDTDAEAAVAPVPVGDVPDLEAVEAVDGPEPVEEPDESREPAVPDDVDYYDLDRDSRAGLRSLPKGLAELVGRRLVMAGRLVDVDPEQALAHAMVARRLASRIAVVREAVGIAAYHAGEWQTAISELRTAQRLTGTRAHVAVIADAERALGRPERAIDAYRDLNESEVDPEVRIELLIVASGARRDLGQGAASVAMLQIPELNGTGTEPWLLRLQFAYADALAAEGRTDEARTWFEKVLGRDEFDELGAGERLLELDGVQWLSEPDESGEDETDD